MKTFYRSILGVLLIGGFFALLAYGLNHLQKPNPLDKVEQRLNEAGQKESVLTENEKKLKQESQTKEWEEIDK